MADTEVHYPDCSYTDGPVDGEPCDCTATADFAQARADAATFEEAGTALLDALTAERVTTAALTAERDQWQREWADRGEIIAMANRTSERRGRERDEARRQVAAVRALHHQAPYALSNPDPDPFCQECDDDYPCATIRALDSAQHQDAPDKETSWTTSSSPSSVQSGSPSATSSAGAATTSGTTSPATPQDTPEGRNLAYLDNMNHADLVREENRMLQCISTWPSSPHNERRQETLDRITALLATPHATPDPRAVYDDDGSDCEHEGCEHVVDYSDGERRICGCPCHRPATPQDTPACTGDDSCTVPEHWTDTARSGPHRDPATMQDAVTPAFRDRVQHTADEIRALPPEQRPALTGKRAGRFPDSDLFRSTTGPATVPIDVDLLREVREHLASHDLYAPSHDHELLSRLPVLPDAQEPAS